MQAEFIGPGSLYGIHRNGRQKERWDGGRSRWMDAMVRAAVRILVEDNGHVELGLELES